MDKLINTLLTLSTVTAPFAAEVILNSAPEKIIKQLKSKVPKENHAEKLYNTAVDLEKSLKVINTIIDKDITVSDYIEFHDSYANRGINDDLQRIFDQYFRDNKEKNLKLIHSVQSNKEYYEDFACFVENIRFQLPDSNVKISVKDIKGKKVLTLDTKLGKTYDFEPFGDLSEEIAFGRWITGDIGDKPGDDIIYTSRRDGFVNLHQRVCRTIHDKLMSNTKVKVYLRNFDQQAFDNFCTDPKGKREIDNYSFMWLKKLKNI